MNQRDYLCHTIAYYVAWLGGLSCAAQGFTGWATLLIFGCVACQIYWLSLIQPNLQGLGYLVGLMVVISTVVDSLLSTYGLIQLAANPFAPYLTAPWMEALWISFTIFLYAVLRKLFNHLWVLACLAGLGFGLAYGLGVRMGAAILPYGYQTLGLIGVIWAVLLPLTVYVYRIIMASK